MKYLFYGLFIANIALAVVGVVIQPETVATHFNLQGQPDGWASREMAAGFSIGIATLLFVLLQFPAGLLFRLPPWMVNLPHKDYWLREENRPAAKARYEICLRSLGTVVFTFLFYIGGFALLANMSQPVVFNKVAPWIGLWLLSVYIVYWTIRFYRLFRLPEDATTSELA